MVVDYLRSAYNSKMRFWNNRFDIETDVIWTRVPPGTPLLPFFSPFASAIWDDPHDAPDDVLGEVWQSPISWYNGRPVAVWPAMMPCGSADQWLNGDTYPPSPLTHIPDTWVPDCCTVSPTPCSVIMQWRIDSPGFTGPCFYNTGPYLTNDPHPDICKWTFDLGGGAVVWVFLLGTGLTRNLDCFFGPGATSIHYNLVIGNASIPVGASFVLARQPGGTCGCTTCPDSVTVTRIA